MFDERLRFEINSSLLKSNDFPHDTSVLIEIGSLVNDSIPRDGKQASYSPIRSACKNT